MKYRVMAEEDMEQIVHKYIEYYNTAEDCCWTFEKAYKRIHQVLTTEDSLCMIQMDDNGDIVGFLMGYYKEFDDITGYSLEEIVIFSGYQNRGYGTAFLQELERVLTENGAVYIELNSVKDEQHKHFYSKMGFYEAKNFVMMGKFFDEE